MNTFRDRCQNTQFFGCNLHSLNSRLFYVYMKVIPLLRLRVLNWLCSIISSITKTYYLVASIDIIDHLFTLLKLWCMLKLQSRFKELEEQMEMKKVTNLSFSLSYAISAQHTQIYQIWLAVLPNCMHYHCPCDWRTFDYVLTLFC